MKDNKMHWDDKDVYFNEDTGEMIDIKIDDNAEINNKDFDDYVNRHIDF